MPYLSFGPRSSSVVLFLFVPASLISKLVGSWSRGFLADKLVQPGSGVLKAHVVDGGLATLTVLNGSQIYSLGLWHAV